MTHDKHAPKITLVTFRATSVIGGGLLCATAEIGTSVLAVVRWFNHPRKV